MIELVIKIPESEIPKQQEIIDIPLHFIDGKVCEAGGYGFDVLPKGHGDLIDKNEIIKRYEKDCGKRIYVDNFVHDIELNIPTIIEADKAGSDK